MYIYLIRNIINGKCYVGQDSNTVEQLNRVKVHFSLGEKLAKNKNLTHFSLIAKAIAKYGSDAFEVEILHDDIESKHDLDIYEKFEILSRKSMLDGYNIRPGGEGLPPNCEVTNADQHAEYFEIRSRGAKTANKNRWENTTAEERREMCQPMFDGCDDAWRQSIKKHWDSLTEEQYADRCRRMSQGRAFRFELTYGGSTHVFYNLRLALGQIDGDDVPISKKQIEAKVRKDFEFACDRFILKKVNND